MLSESTTRYQEQWPAASRAYETATAFMPGGNTRTQTYVAPFPMYARSGVGATLELVDGTRVDDFLLNYTAAAVGHGQPDVVKAIKGSIEAGAPFGIPGLDEVALADALCNRFDVIERVRFTSSGSEATQQALKVARAFTGKPLIAKAEGGYHGSHDFVDISVTKYGPTSSTAIAEAPGTPDAVRDSVVVFPYNDLEGALAILDERRDALAAVILEPILNSGGSVPATPEFLAGVSSWCRRSGVVFVADEVATWRTGYQGVAYELGVSPDLICLGKALGGGLPIGVLGGRADILDLYDPRGGSVLRHAGTFNAHPAPMAAGLVVLDLLSPDAVRRMGAQGDRICSEIISIGQELDLPLSSTQHGGFGRLHISRRPPRSGRESAACPGAPRVELYRALLERGTLIGHDGRYALSTVTTDAQVSDFLERLRTVAPDVLAQVTDAPAAV